VTWIHFAKRFESNTEVASHPLLLTNLLDKEHTEWHDSHTHVLLTH
jgi:hypothetical protein